MLQRSPLVTSSVSDPVAEPKSYYPAFDYLRFALAVIVVVCHCYGDHLWIRTGNLAVRIFFALSGWLIGGILLHATRDDLPRFYFNRATRIWIPYFAAIVLLFGLSAIREIPSPRHIEFLIYCVTFTWNWFTALPDPVTALSKLPFGWGGAQFWSICVEEQFYLVAPILIVLIPAVGRSLVAWALICAVLIASQNEFAPISLGVLAAVTNKTFANWHQTRVATIILSTVCLLCAVFMTTSYFLISPFFAISVVLLLARRGSSSGLGLFLGGASYPIYLNHELGSVILLSLAKRLFPVWGAHKENIMAGSLVLGVVVGIVMYLLIDRIVMARRGAYFSNARGKFIAAIGYCLVVSGLTFGILRWYVFS